MSFLRLVHFNWGSLSRTSLGVASLSAFDIEIASLGCLITYETMVSLMLQNVPPDSSLSPEQFYLTILLPFIVAIVLIFFWLVATKAPFLLPAKVKVKLRNVHVPWLLWRSYNSFLTTAHTFISWRIFGAFIWDEVGGVERLQDFLEIERDSNRGRAQLAGASIMCILLTAGYPLFLVYHLYQTNWGRAIGRGSEVNHVLGHLVADYEPGKRYLVVPEMIIKLLQVIVLRFGQSVTVQSISFTLFLLLYFGMQVYLSPYRVDLEDAQRDHNRRQVSVHFSTTSDLPLFRYIYFKLSSLQLKEQASAWMFSLAMVVLLLGLISLGLDDSIIVGVLTLIAIASMIFICFLFAFRAFRARTKKDHLEDFATQDRPVVAGAPFETEMGPMNTDEQEWTQNSHCSE